MDQKQEDLQSKFSFHYSTNNFESLVMLCSVQSMISKMFKLSKLTYYWLYEQASQITKTLQFVQLQIQKRSKIVNNLNEIASNIISPNENKIIIICNEEKKNEIQALFQRKHNFLGFIIYQPKEMIELKSFNKSISFSIQENQICLYKISNQTKVQYVYGIEQLIFTLDEKNWVQTPVNQFPNFISIKRNFEKSYVLVDTMMAMVVQKIDQQMRIQIINQLQAFVDKICYYHTKLQNKRKKLMNILGLLKTKKLPTVQVIRLYTSEDYGLYILINVCLRSLKCPTQLFYIQPIFKQLFSAIKNIYQSNPKQSFICYRGGSISVQERLQITSYVGQIVQNLGFLSTSLLQSTAFSFSRDAFYEIQVEESGQNNEQQNFGYADVSNYSDFCSEREVIFNPLNYFKIFQVKKYYKSKQFDEEELIVVKMKQYKITCSRLEYQKSQNIINFQDFSDIDILRIILSYKKQREDGEINQGQILLNQGSNYLKSLFYWSKYLRIVQNFSNQLTEDYSVFENKNKFKESFEVFKSYQNNCNIKVKKQDLEKRLKRMQKYKYEGLFQKSIALINLKRKQQALVLLKKCEQYYPKSCQKYQYIFIWLARCLSDLRLQNKTLQQISKFQKDHHGHLSQNISIFLQLKKIEAKLLKNNGKYKQAIEILKKYHQMALQFWGQLSRLYIKYIWIMASCLFQFGKYFEALNLFLKVDHYCKIVMGEESLIRAEAYSNIAFVLIKLDRHAESLVILEKCLKINQKVLNVKTAFYFLVRYHISICFKMLGDFQGSYNLLLSDQEDKKRILGQLHPDYLISLCLQADCLYLLGETKKSIILYEQCLYSQKKIIGDGHMQYLITLSNYCSLLMKYGMIEEAAKNLKSCKDKIYELIGEENQFYLRTKSKFVECLFIKGEYLVVIKMSSQCYRLSIKLMQTYEKDSLYQIFCEEMLSILWKSLFESLQLRSSYIILKKFYNCTTTKLYPSNNMIDQKSFLDFNQNIFKKATKCKNRRKKNMNFIDYF